MITAITCMMIGLGQSAPAAASSEHVFLITTNDGRALSGFKLAGTPGIITCLHGVAGADRILAKRSSGQPFVHPLRIVKVDVARDLALLTSPEVENLKGGFSVAVGTNLSELDKVTTQVIGYPAGVDKKEMANTLEVRKPAVKKLDDCINDKLRGQFNLRKSPSPGIDVLSLQGPLYPGHSGAVILDADGNAIAVADGGLGYFDEYQSGGKVWKDTLLVWAIPIQDVTWARYSDHVVFDEVARIAALKRLGCFALGDPEKMQVVLSDYYVLDAQGDTIITVMKYSPAVYQQKLFATAFSIWNRPDRDFRGAGPVHGIINESVDNLLFAVTPGTQVAVIPEDAMDRTSMFSMFGGTHKKIRILSGDFEGEIGWVPTQFLRKKQMAGRD